MKLYLSILFMLFGLNQALAQDIGGVTTISLWDDEDEGSDPTRITYANVKTTTYTKQLKLSEVKDTIKFDIKNAFDLPNSMSVIRKNIRKQHISSQIKRNITFTIDKTKLQNGDNIIIKTKQGNTIANIGVVK